MKKNILLAISICMFIMLQAQVSKTVNVTEGSLSALLTANEKSTITDVSITGVKSKMIAVTQAVLSNVQEWNFSSTSLSALGTISATKTVEGLTIYAATGAEVVIDAHNKTLDGMTFTNRLKLGGSGTFDADGKPVSKVLSFEVAGNTTITVMGMSNSSTADRQLIVAAGKKETEIGRFPALGASISKGEFTYTGGPTTIYLFSSSAGINLYYVKASLQVLKTTVVTAGGLKTALTAEELASITDLTLSGTIDARDFKTMRDDMPLLAKIDISSATVLAYTGTGGTAGASSIAYSADAVPDYAFADKINWQSKKSLTSILLPSTIKAIGNSSFFSCSGLTTITIPSSVTSIGLWAFANSGSLIIVDASNPIYSSNEGVLFDKTQSTLIQCTNSTIGSYTIPSSVTVIGSSAFFYGMGLTSIIIPSSVISIGDGAFWYCSGLTAITIPSSVTSIGNGAFYACSGLSSIYVNSNSPVNLSSSSNVFLYVDKNICTLHVPYGARTAYLAANQWKDFVNIVEMQPVFSLSANNANVAATQGSMTTVELTSNTTWAASSDQTWLTVSPTSGTGNSMLTFTAEANTSSAIRTAIVTVSATGSESQKITITQTGQNFDPYLLKQDSLALVALYNTTDGPNWTKKANWLTGKVDTWEGVTVENGRVVELKLGDSNTSVGLVGHIPAELSNLTAIRNLELYNNQLSGSLPDSWSVLVNLQGLNLSANQLTGTLPDSWSALVNLKWFFLNYNQLTGGLPGSWSTLVNLQALNLSANQLTGTLPYSWSSLQNLQHLNSSENKLSGILPGGWSSLINLQGLYLHSNQFSGTLPESWSALVNLQKLNLGSNQLTGALPGSWSALVNLQELWLYSNQLTGVLPGSWSALVNLQKLNLGNNQLTGALPGSWSALVNLQVLHLWINHFTGTLPESWTALVNLKELLLQYNQISGLPDLAPMINLNKLSVQSNLLDFGDIEPNIGVPNSIFEYSPQAPVGIADTIFLKTGQEFRTSVTVGGSSSQYTWYKDGNPIPLASGSEYVIPSVVLSDNGIYNYFSTNTVVTGLTLWSNPITLNVALPSINETDSLALVALYNQCDGINWTRKANWLTGKVDTWEGVTVENGRVVELKLGDWNTSVGLVGHIPAELSNLTAIRNLELYNNQLSGTLPESWSALVNLYGLHLVGNQLTGTLPASWSALVNLQSLNIGSNQLTGMLPESWSGLVNLQMLYLHNNQFSGNLPASWSALVNLQQLYLEHNQLSGTLPESWSALVNLYGLHLVGNQLTGTLPASWSALVNLQSLNIGSNQLTGTFPDSWSALMNLQMLYLHNNQFSGNLPASWSALVNLQQLYLEYNKLTGSLPSSWSALINLQCLHLDNNQISGLPDFAPMINLNNLTVQNNLLDFGDIEPNIGVPKNEFSYFPQAKFGNAEIYNKQHGEALTLIATVGGTGNLYQWYKDGNLVDGKTANTLVFDALSETDFGNYSCMVTNPNIPNLTLESETLSITVVPNNAPIANAGPDQSVNEGNLVTLNGSVSSDPNGNPLTYKWTAPTGITLSSTTDAQPTFTAPEVSVNTDYTFSLVVNDGTTDSQPDQVIITVNNIILAQHFTPIWSGNGFDHMNINIYSAKLDGVELEAGDEIGIFDGTSCVGARILTGTITQTNTLDIVVSRNDDSGNGYTSGNSISYKLYDKSQDLENSNLSVVYDNTDPLWSADGKFTIAATAFVELTGLTKVNQDIVLNIGWNIISVNVIPANLNLKDIFQTLIDAGKLKKVMDEAGKTIENFGAFGGWKNNIGNLNTTKGYKVNVNATSTLSLEGTPVQLPLDINLNIGWNIISYPCASAQDAKALVQSLIDAGKLKKVMDEAGKTIENFGAFGGWKNNIGNFLPNKGYKVNVLENCTLTIPATTAKAATIVPEVLASTHFDKVFKGNGTDHMSINLVNLQASGLVAGDEIGIFDGRLCVGSATVGTEQLMAGSISIPASANDELATEANGFNSGNPVILRLFRNNREYRLSPEILNNSKSTFAKGESMFARVNTELATNLGELTGHVSVKCYPNPFSEQVTIELQFQKSQKLDVKIYDLNGKLVRILYKGESEEREVLVWDGKNEQGAKVVPGSYLLKANEVVKKIIMKN